MKYRFFRKHFLFLFIFLFSLCGFGQQSIIENNLLTDFNNALQLFDNKAYAAAQKIFINIDKTAVQSSNLKADAAYYDAMCAIKLNTTDADKKVLAFVEEYPNSTKKNKAFFNVANFYFSNKKASYALKWFQKVNLYLLSEENKKEVNFKMGYGFLVTNNLNLAKERFLPLINDAKYGNDSRYYYGFISYKLEDYGIAESTLQEIADNKSYSAEISYYLLDISFKAGKFERCIDVGTKLLETARKKDQSEISKIVGESYFNLKQYKESIPYLQAYKGKKGKWNNTDFYQLGYAFYQQNDFENAVNYFNKIIDEKNTVSQNAYNHLGECYLKLDKKLEALNAFKTASEMDFNRDIKEDAALNYAKLSYEEGNPFKSVADVLQDYLKNYPKSSSYNEINELVVSSFLHQQDYEGALAFLAKKKSTVNNILSLEVSLYRGIQLFNESKFVEAQPFFKKSIASNNDAIKHKAQYWEAETAYRLENFSVALEKFTRLKSAINTNNDEFNLVDYQIGYSNFKLKNYDNAANSFQSFLNLSSNDQQIKDDAIVRLGDCYYATSNYKNAVEQYAKIVNEFGAGADYAQYQIGMSYGFMGSNADKISALTKVVNEYEVSTLKDDALYQLASTYTTMKETQNAHNAYNRLIQKHPNSVFLPKAMLRQGLLFYNENRSEEALDTYKKVTSQFPNSSDAVEAVSNARNIYIDNGNLDEYISWVKTLKFINVTNSDLDNTTFAVAEKKYFESKDQHEISQSLLNYTNKFPEGIHKLKANFYAAESLFKQQYFDSATGHYKIVIGAGQNEFREESLNKLAQIYLQKEDFKAALPILTTLEQEAYATENIVFAQSNLMKGYFETASYDLAIAYAKKLLQSTKIENSLENDAKIIIARAALKTDDEITAEEYYTAIERNATGNLKAEALYYNAYFKNNQKEYAASNKVVQDLIANYSAYKYWAVNSYVIMGKNYYGLKDVYQATYVLENVIKNFTQFEDIVQEAKTTLDAIKEKEAKTNNSVSPNKTEISNKETKN
ncbi:tetratricopeptide repeat protein [Polaribacter sp.]|uniref:tetratricopeptide repeat protein n=1 Tax=Polaribacter sp. TaxID=1920175 RepID=UPI003EF2D828